MVYACAIFSLALMFVVPSLYASGKYLNISLIASNAKPLVVPILAVTVPDTGCVTAELSVLRAPPAETVGSPSDR